MGRAAQPPIFSAADYLRWKAAQTERHEYIDGEVCAMAGAEDRHVTVAGNLYMALRTYMSAMRLHVAAANSCFYPDVLVTCSALDQASAMVKTEPGSSPKCFRQPLRPTTAG